MGASLPPISATNIQAVGGALDFKTRLSYGRADASVRNPRLLDQDSTLATVTTSATFSTSGKSFYPSAVTTIQNFKDAFLLENASWISTNGGAGAIVGMNAHSNPVAASGVNWTSTFVTGTVSNMFRITFWSNSPNITVKTTSNGIFRPRFLIDNQYINKSGHARTVTGTTATDQYDTLAFSSTKMCLITIELQQGIALQRVYYDFGYTAAPPISNKLCVAVIGDSYAVGPAIGTGVIADGTYPTMPSDPSACFNGDGIWQQAADWGGWENIPFPVGGTGFVGVSGGRTDNNYDGRFSDLTSQYVTKTFDVVILQGSVNDGFQSTDISGAVKTATKALCNKALAAFPKAKILLTGVFPCGGSSLSKFQLNETTNATVVSEINDNRLAFVPIQTTTPIIPFWPTSGTGNPMIADDYVHLTPVVGHGSVGRWLSSQVYNSLMNMPV